MAADFAFVVAFAGERALGKDDTGLSGGGKMKDEVLEPCEVGIAHGRDAVLPAGIITQLIAAPVAVVERGVGKNVVGANVLVGVVEEGTFAVPFDLRTVDGANGEIHLGEPPCGLIAFLPEDGQVPDASLMFPHELFTLHEHAAAAAAGVHDAAPEGFEHGDKQFDDAAGRVELSALFAFGKGKFAEEIFKDMAENVGAVRGRILKGDAGNKVDQGTERRGIEVLARVDLGQNVLEGGIFLFDGVHGLVQQGAYVGVPGVVAQVGPAGGRRHKENVFCLVFVAVFGIGSFVFAFAFREGCKERFKGIGDVFEKDQAEYDVLVFGGVNILAQLVRRAPELFFQRFRGFFLLRACHEGSLSL